MSLLLLLLLADDVGMMIKQPVSDCHSVADIILSATDVMSISRTISGLIRRLKLS